MGAISIEVRGYGNNISEAFKNAQDEAQKEHGEDSYNGAINNCHLVRDVTTKRPSMHPNDLHDYILSSTNKREVMGYCESQPKLNENKVKTKVESFPQEGTRQWKTVYKAVDWDEVVHCSAPTQTQCIKKARAIVADKPNLSLSVIVTKELERGNRTCAKIEYKRAAGEKVGQYLFIGFAPC